MQIVTFRNEHKRLACEDCGGRLPIMVMFEIGRKVDIGIRGGTTRGLILDTPCARKLEKLIKTELSRPHMQEVAQSAGDI